MQNPQSYPNPGSVYIGRGNTLCTLSDIIQADTVKNASDDSFGGAIYNILNARKVKHNCMSDYITGTINTNNDVKNFGTNSIPCGTYSGNPNRKFLDDNNSWRNTNKFYKKF